MDDLGRPRGGGVTGRAGGTPPAGGGGGGAPGAGAGGPRAARRPNRPPDGFGGLRPPVPAQPERPAGRVPAAGRNRPRQVS